MNLLNKASFNHAVKVALAVALAGAITSEWSWINTLPNHELYTASLIPVIGYVEHWLRSFGIDVNILK